MFYANVGCGSEVGTLTVSPSPSHRSIFLSACDLKGLPELFLAPYDLVKGKIKDF